MIPKRRLSELLTQYKLQRELRDLVVEGRSDQAIFETIFAGKLPLGSKIWKIDDIDIDCCECTSIGGNRQRIIDVCKWLLENEIGNMYGAADRDIVSDAEYFPYKSGVFYTFWTSIEFHILNIDKLFEVVETVSGHNFPAPDKLEIVQLSKKVYLLRKEGLRLDTKLSLPPLSRGLSYSGGIEFSVDSYFARVDSKNGTGKRWSEWARGNWDVLEVNGMAEKTVLVRDFEEIVDWYLRAVRGGKKTFGIERWITEFAKIRLDRGVCIDIFFQRIGVSIGIMT